MKQVCGLALVVLLLLPAVSASAFTFEAGSGRFAGTWRATWDGTPGNLRLSEERGMIIGRYHFIRNRSEVRGVLSGTVEGNVLRGSYATSLKGSGNFELTVDAAGRNFKGYYVYQGQRFFWNGERK